jgi:hypothetical protein
MKGPRRLSRRGPGTGPVAMVNGSRHGSGGDNGVPMEAAMTGSQRQQRVLQSLPWRSGSGSMRGQQNFVK